jgi:hypothetical protein
MILSSSRTLHARLFGSRRGYEEIVEERLAGGEILPANKVAGCALHS